MSDYNIRPAKDTEEERIFIEKLNFDSFRVAFQLQEDISDEEAYRRYRKIEDDDPLDPFSKNHAVFMLETGASVRMGLIWLAVREAFYVFKEPLVWIYNINIDPMHRRKGLAKTLLKKAEKWTIDNGFSQIGLRLIEQNNNARRAYEKHGYQQIAQHNFSCFYLKNL